MVRVDISRKFHMTIFFYKNKSITFKNFKCAFIPKQKFFKIFHKCVFGFLDSHNTVAITAGRVFVVLSCGSCDFFSLYSLSALKKSSSL